MPNEFQFDEGFEKYNIEKQHLKYFDRDPKLSKIHKKIIQRRYFYEYQSADSIIKSEIIPRFENAHIDANERGRILFLHGDYNSGKSYLVRFTAAVCKKTKEEYWLKTDDGRITHPIIIRNLPSDIRSVEKLYTWLLDTLGNPVDPKALKTWEKTKIKIVKLQKKVIETLNGYETRLLILDESQRLLRAGDNHQVSSILEAFKDLTTKNHWDEVGCHNRPYIILCGTSDCVALLRIGKFIQGRVHTRQLNSISFKNYPKFLSEIYTDYIQLGISDKWDLLESIEGKLIVNNEMALTLFKRTRGMAGLTVEIVRDAVLASLLAGLEYPTLDFYKEVILEGTKYVFHSSDNSNSTPFRAEVDVDNLICDFKGCVRSKIPYSAIHHLLNHYKKKHPEAEVYDKERNRLDNN